MRVATVIGARPQFIKAATVSHALSEYGDSAEILVHTGQHHDANMSDVFFAELGISQAILQNLDPQGSEIALYGEGRAAGQIVEALLARGSSK